MLSQGWTAHGLGRLVFPGSSTFYFGPFVDGEPSGKGKFVKVLCLFGQFTMSISRRCDDVLHSTDVGMLQTRIPFLLA